MKKLAKILGIAVVLLLVIIIVATKSAKEAPPSATHETENIIDSTLLQEVFKEKRIKQAVVNQKILYATVDDDGSNRKGYAEYLAQIAKEFKGSTVERVMVVAYGTQNAKNADTPYGKLLGASFVK